MGLTPPPPGSRYLRPSWTDPITNAVRLQPLRLGKHLLGIINGRLSADCLPALLHEGMHHWCFLTPLGHALALQQLRGRSILTAAEVKSEEARVTEATDALARFQAIDSILRPVAEGLALLAELHGTYDHTRAEELSRPQMWAMGLTCRNVPDAEKAQVFAALFLEQAHSKKGIARQVKVFSQPFDCRLGGYLPGYMALRALWHRTGRIHEDLQTVSDFIAAVRFAVYYDAELLELALGGQEVTDYHEISRKAAKRLEQILVPQMLLDASCMRMCLEGLVYTFEDLTKAARCDQSIGGEMPQSLSYGEELTEAILRLGRLFEAVKDNGLMEQRDLFWLASEDATVKWSGGTLCLKLVGGWIAIGQGQIDDLPHCVDPDLNRWYPVALEDGQVPEGEFTARVDLVFSLSDTWLMLAAFAGKELMTATPLIGKHFTKHLDVFRNEGLDSIEAKEEEVSRMAHKRMPANMTAKLYALRKQAFLLADQTCARVVFRRRNRAKQDALIAALNENGWAGPLGSDPQLLRCLALASTTATMGPHRRDPAVLLGASGVPQDALRRVSLVLEKFGAGFLLDPLHND